MAKHHELGQKGEQCAFDFLQDKGYEMLETNWRHRRAEVDIIARHEGVLIFVEVKTRSTDFFGDPAEAVTAAKQTLMAKAAIAYMDQIQHDWEIRFDIISIIYTSDTNIRITHLEDVFFPQG